MKKTPCFASFSYWGVHWLKLAPELKKVPGGKTTTHNILFEPILPNFEEIFEIGHDDFGGCPTLPVRKTGPKKPLLGPGGWKRDPICKIKHTKLTNQHNSDG